MPRVLQPHAVYTVTDDTGQHVGALVVAEQEMTTVSRAGRAALLLVTNDRDAKVGATTLKAQRPDQLRAITGTGLPASTAGYVLADLLGP